METINRVLAALARKIPQHLSGPFIILSFMAVLAVLNYCIVSMATYVIVGAVLLVCWMIIGKLLTDQYKK
ncbi:MAG: hypothetical protein CSA33_03925 [Desulfobulbus propionicus]|nr:MAG: hypothetical protein CSA33_03925 [Desulfobulbus propionicus]